MSLPVFYQKVIAKLPNNMDMAASVIAVCVQESKCCPTFSVSDPLYQANLKAAADYTKLPPLLIQEAAMIKQGPLRGFLGKFRFEPGYWAWSGEHQLPSATDRFLVSCSWGVGQQMMRWVVPSAVDTWPEWVEEFKGSVSLQVDQVIHELGRLLVETNGDLLRAYKGYNSGNISCKDIAVMTRALRVIQFKDIVEKQIKAG
jgi:hypothetical protein